MYLTSRSRLERFGTNFGGGSSGEVSTPGSLCPSILVRLLLTPSSFLHNSSNRVLTILQAAPPRPTLSFPAPFVSSFTQPLPSPSRQTLPSRLKSPPSSTYRATQRHAFHLFHRQGFRHWSLARRWRRSAEQQQLLVFERPKLERIFQRFRFSYG